MIIAGHSLCLLGVNCNEACNVAPRVWLDWGHKAIKAYRYLRPLCVPYEQLLYISAVCNETLCEGALRKLIREVTKIITEGVNNNYCVILLFRRVVVAL